MNLRPISLLTLTLPALTLATCILPAQGIGKIQKGEMAGYLLAPNEKVPEGYNAGFSMYVAAWPLLDQYPRQRFQTGLFGTWLPAGRYDLARIGDGGDARSFASSVQRFAAGEAIPVAMPAYGGFVATLKPVR